MAFFGVGAGEIDSGPEEHAESEGCGLLRDREDCREEGEPPD